MHLLSVNKLGAEIDGRWLFSDVTFGLRQSDRVGVVGPNGSGKSTLLRMLAGDISRNDGPITVAGQITPRRSLRVSWLPQQAEWPDDLAAGVVLNGIDEVAHRHEAEAMLSRLGIDPLQPTSTMSGGQRRRVALARVLIVPADVLLLDEPTNHLDVESIGWLEQELQSRQSAVIMVTHDRYLLDRTTNRMLDLAPVGGSVFELGERPAAESFASARWHDGNYSSLLEARADAARAQRNQTHKAQVLLAKEIAWLRRQPRARGSKPKFRQQQALELAATAQGPAERALLQLGTGRRRLGNDVIELREVTCNRGERNVLNGVDLTLGPGERVGVVGPNGSGKTTLLEVAMGIVPAAAGQVRRGTTVHLGYYPQEASTAPSGETVLDRLLGVAAHIPLANGETLPAATLAERFGFPPRLQRAPINQLSGGERRRLALLEVLIDAPNVIVMDEPTNDLDLDTLGVLEDYLDGFGGSLLIASHDRYVLDRLTDRIIAVEHGSLHEFIEFADYDATRDNRTSRTSSLAGPDGQRSATPSGHTTAPSKPHNAGGATSIDRDVNRLRQQVRKDRRRAEERLERLAAQRDELAVTMARAATDPERLLSLQADFRHLETQMEVAEADWFAAAEAEESLHRPAD